MTADGAGSTPVSAATLARLRRLNLLFGGAHGLQAVAMVAFSNALSLPVTAVFANGPPGQPIRPATISLLFTYRLGLAVALFSGLSAFFHLLVASPWGLGRYGRELERDRNRFRWVEYSLSSSLMIVLIAGITGITDIVALLALFSTNAAMIFFGWLMETGNASRPARHWSAFLFGCLAGVVPWVSIVIYLVGAGDDVPTFVYGIFVSLFLMFNCFAVNQFLQYRARGRWADYLFGERVYIWLSLVAKSLLAWQIFANTLV